MQTGVGTMGGFVDVDGKIYCLIYHHVCFGKRLNLYPSKQDELNKRIVINNPPNKDLELIIEGEKSSLQAFQSDEVNFKYKILRAQERLSIAEKWKSNALGWNTMLGWVYKSSGICICEMERGRRWRLDWALIELLPDRINDSVKITNEVCQPLTTTPRQ